jgi:hypothetical protein|tara:strand:+ start:983 stop:1405 length:423 start_codon:yes stop_codon:yes gene_type:complete
MASKVNLDVSEKLDITCRQGDSFSLTLTLKDSSGTALTLSTDNYSFLMQVYRSGGSVKNTSPVLGSSNLGKQVDNSFEAFVIDDSGNVTISATAATMRNIKAGRYVYDLQQIKPTASGVDTHTTLLRGSFIVNSDVSKSL